MKIADNVACFSTVEESQFMVVNVVYGKVAYLTTFPNLTALQRTNKIWLNCGYSSFN